MKLTFLGTQGELGFERKSCFCPQCTEARDLGVGYPHRNSSSLLVEVEGLNSPTGDPTYSRMLIDVGWGIRKGIEEVEPDCVLLTSAHPNHAAGIIRIDPTVPVIFTHRTFMAVKPYIRTGRRFYLIKQNKPFHFNQCKVVAYEVYRSYQSTVCYKIDDRVVYAPDCLGFKDEWILDGADLYICDGSTLHRDMVPHRASRIGHMSVEKSVALARKHGTKKIIVAHIGHLRLSCLDMQRAVSAMGAEIAFDGMGLTNPENIV